MERKIICITPRDWYPLVCAEDGTIESIELEHLTGTERPKGNPLILKDFADGERRVWIMLIYNDNAKAEGLAFNRKVYKFTNLEVYGNAVLAIDKRGCKKLMGFTPKAFDHVVDAFLGGDDE